MASFLKRGGREWKDLLLASVSRSALDVYLTKAPKREAKITEKGLGMWRNDIAFQGITQKR